MHPNRKSSADDVFVWDKPPKTRVVALISVISHHEIVPLGYYPLLNPRVVVEISIDRVWSVTEYFFKLELRDSRKYIRCLIYSNFILTFSFSFFIFGPRFQN